MPRHRNTHWNPGNGTGRTACGRILGKVEHTHDINDVDCNVCQKVLASLEAVGS